MQEVNDWFPWAYYAAEADCLKTSTDNPLIESTKD